MEQGDERMTKGSSERGSTGLGCKKVSARKEQRSKGSKKEGGWKRKRAIDEVIEQAGKGAESRGERE